MVSLGMFALGTAICQYLRCNSDIYDTSEALYCYLLSVKEVVLTTTSPNGKESLSECHLSAQLKELLGIKVQIFTFNSRNGIVLTAKTEKETSVLNPT